MTTYRVSHVTGTVTDMGLLIGKGIASTGRKPSFFRKKK